MKKTYFELYSSIQNILPECHKDTRKEWEEQAKQRESNFRLFLYKNYYKIQKKLIFGLFIYGAILCIVIKLLINFNKPLALLITIISAILIIFWLIAYEFITFLTPHPKFDWNKMPGYLIVNSNESLEKIYNDCKWEIERINRKTRFIIASLFGISLGVFLDGILDNNFLIAVINMISYGNLVEAWKVSYAGTLSFFLLIFFGITYLVASYPAFLLSNLREVLEFYFKSSNIKK